MNTAVRYRVISPRLRNPARESRGQRPIDCDTVPPLPRRATSNRRFILSSLGLALILVGCSREEHAVKSASHDHAHSHAPKHGGALVELGEEEFHLEVAYGDTPGVLQAFVMDAHVEDYVRISASSFVASVTMAGQEHLLAFTAVASAATGETTGDTSLFEARADWLAARPALSITIPTITVKGRHYTAIAVALPGRGKP
jgi:hypothetical protein